MSRLRALGHGRCIAPDHAGWPMGWVHLFLAALLACMGHGASATITCTAGPGDFTIPLPANITVSADLPIGTWIGNRTTPTGNYNGYQCTMAFEAFMLQAQSMLSGSMVMTLDGASTTVYPTGIAGVGVAFWLTANIGGTAYAETPVTGYQTWVTGGSKSSGTLTQNMGMMVAARLVKTGAMTAGAVNLPSMVVLDTRSKTDNNLYHSKYSFAAATITVAIPSCSVENATVALGTRSLSSFTGMGSRTGERSFSVALACTAGVSSIQYTLHAVNGYIGLAANSTSQLVPGAGVATGVGVRIANPATDNPIGFDTNIVFSDFTSAAGTYRIPLKAAYIQTGSSVGAGSANAQVELTVQYN